MAAIHAPAETAAAYDYDSANRRSPALEELLALARYSDLLRLLVVNNLKTRYRRSLLGVAWTLFNPLLSMLVLTIAFSALFRTSLESYPVYVLAGVLFWNFFAQSTTTAMRSLVWGGSLIKVIYVPRTVFAVAAIGTSLVNWLIGLIPLALIMLALGHPIRLVALAALPAAVLLGALFALGLSLLLSSLSVLYPDVVDIYDVLLKALFYLTPVMFPPEIVPPQFAWLLALNPLYYLLEVFRTPIYAGVWPAPQHFLLALAGALALLAAGWWFFTSQADELAYRV